MSKKYGDTSVRTGIIRLGCAALAVWFLLLTGCARADHPRARHGVLDLTGWDLAANGMVRLDGEWEFYWDRLLTHRDFLDGAPRPDDYFTLPGSWFRYDLNGRRLDAFGYATYRLVILTRPDRPEKLSLKIPKMSTAYNLYQNGELVASNGRVGTSAETMAPAYLPLIADLSPDNGRTELVLQISNFVERLGGLRESVFLGEKNDIHRNGTFGLAFDLLLFGCVFLFGLYHLNIFFHRRKDFVSLYFGIFCVLIAFRAVIAGNTLIAQLIPTIDWMLGARVFVTTYFLAVGVFALFVRELYPEFFPKIILYVILGVSGVCCLIGIFTPIIVFSYAVAIFNFFTLAACVWELVVLVRALIAKRPGALSLLVASGIFFAAVVNDIFFQETYFQSITLIPFGLLIFIMIQVFFLGRRFSQSLTKVEAMSVELTTVNREVNELNVTLERKVEERTAELEKTKNEVIKASRDKARFFINIAHEIKTPLTLIHNYLKAYIDRVGLSDELKVIKQNFQKMLNDILNFLDLEKLEQGKLFYSHDKPLNLSEAVRQKAEIFRSTAERRQVRLVCRAGEDLYAKADPLALERIVNNLLDNAVKFTPAGGEVRISVEDRDLQVRLCVEDTGPGIPEHLRERIFQPYVQLGGNDQNSRGVGMGLFIVKKTVESLDGSIVIGSSPEGGACFTVTFEQYFMKRDKRRAQAAAAGRNESPAVTKDVTAETPDGPKPDIMIIEDNEDMRTFLCDYLSRKYVVHTARNGREALEMLSSAPEPRLIISDIMMDEMDGFEFLDRLQSDEGHAGVPVIFLTAKATTAHRLEGLYKGAIDYIYKPFEIEELAAKVDAVVANVDRRQRAEAEKLKHHMERALQTYPAGDEASADRPAPEGWSARLNSLIAEQRISEREAEVIVLVTRGLQHKEIAAELGISVKTVGNHISRIYQKLGVENKVELMNLLAAGGRRRPD